ncbi:MAG TPA: hypothetical protein VF070_41590 [Streptosporangiaceae bacterium]
MLNGAIILLNGRPEEHAGWMTHTITWQRTMYALYIIAAIALLLYTIGAPASAGN